MPTRSVLSAAVVAAAFSLSLAASPTSASAYECEEQVNEALQEQGVNQTDVDSVKLARRTGGARSSSIYSYDAWVRLKSCSNGAVVVNLTKYCMVKQVYTTGDCEVSGMPSY